MKLPLRAMPFCVVTALAFAALPSSAQTNPQALPVNAVPNIGFFGEFRHVTISPDSKLVVSARESRVKLWDFATGRLLRNMNAGSDVTAVVFSPDSKTILSASKDKTAKLWDVTTGRVVGTFEGHSATVNAVAFSADGSRILSASDDKTVKLWDVATGRLLRTFVGHSGKVGSVAFSPDGSRVLSGANDQTARLWDVANGSLVRTFQAEPNLRPYSELRQEDSAVPVAFLRDGARIVLGGGSVTLWNTASGQLLRTFEANIAGQFLASALSFEVSVDDNRLAAHVLLARRQGTERCYVSPCPPSGTMVRGSDATAIWDVTTGRQLRLWSSDVRQPAMSRDGAHLLTESQLEDTVTGRVVRKFQRLSPFGEMAVLSPNGERAAVGSRQAPSIWSISTGQLLRTLKPTTEPKNTQRLLAAAFSEESDRMMTISLDNSNSVWVVIRDVEKDQILKSTNIKSYADTAAISADWNLALLASQDSAQLWSLSSGTLVRKFASKGYVKSVAVSRDGTRVAVGTDRVTVWDAVTGELLREVHPVEKGGDIITLVFSPDGTKLISAEDTSGWLSPVKVWDVTNGQLLLDVKGYVWTAAFSPDGKRIIARDYSRAVKSWDLATKQLIRDIDVSEFPGNVRASAISADATRVLVTDNRAAVWSLESGELLATLITSENGEWVVFTPEGYFDGTKNATDMFTVVRSLDIVATDEVEKTLRRPDLLRQKLKASPVGMPRPIESRH